MLPEINRRNRAGAVIDRRIGENDRTMSFEERMLQRFTREKQRTKRSTFDLEADNDEELTHFGRSLNLEGEPLVDDDDNSVTDIANPDWRVNNNFSAQNQGLDPIFKGEEDDVGGRTGERRSRAAVMKDVVAKSKAMKYERQQEKEEDEELRHELDKELPSVLAAWNSNISIKSARAADSPNGNRDNTLNGANGKTRKHGDQSATEKAYDAHIRELILDKRARPSDRTKTDIEKTAEEQERRLTHENDMLRRMRGEGLEDIGSDAENNFANGIVESADEDNDAAEFGFVDKKDDQKPFSVEDEDNFIIDSDLVAEDSDINVDVSSEYSTDLENHQLLHGEEKQRSDLSSPKEENSDFADDTYLIRAEDAQNSSMSAVNSCPETHNDFLSILKQSDEDQTSRIIQRIRSLHIQATHADSKDKLAKFASILVDHIHYLPSKASENTLPVIGATIRHVHSMARNHSETVANAFRSHLQRMYESKDLDPGDLMLLTAISSIYPTSDHFHQIVTPAMTIMASWLELNNPRNERIATTGAYIGALCLKYQSFAKRYVPELLRFTILTLKSTPSSNIIKIYGDMLVEMAGLWAGKPAFPEMFGSNLLNILSKLDMNGPLSKIRQYLHHACINRRPLELHHHRPIPIKTAIPKFEEFYNPEKHYDPDRERADSKKLRADYKRERKGALRELRKDANFIAREKLRQKRETDAAYEQKYKRLVAEIQGEEAKEKNAYERTKRDRKARR